VESRRGERESKKNHRPPYGGRSEEDTRHVESVHLQSIQGIQVSAMRCEEDSSRLAVERWRRRSPASSYSPLSESVLCPPGMWLMASVS
jgi:hypothetical protein